ncbi:Tethering factor for nuclear proteasome sts1 [Lodderomyces elongisporus]|uniref:Tethering factor for nuclear proteasome sts1 n=1 Tax=Lodderomyces elongisporus TaxID=36914 RepID=UPI002922BEA9|nr:Tethering factor for nuclear proteasome sts1 [Lodderomyces elongisporus]WLF76702.1 Tethering factor for nuclear proteasome sts1 [Lodderomyces elongisporus]
MMSASFHWKHRSNEQGKNPLDKSAMPSSTSHYMSTNNSTNNGTGTSTNTSGSSSHYTIAPRSFSEMVPSQQQQQQNKKRKRYSDDDSETHNETHSENNNDTSQEQFKPHNHRDQTASGLSHLQQQQSQQQHSSSSSQQLHYFHGSSKTKRTKIPKIIGQPLPTSRLIESLDKTHLEKLLHSLIDIHPELNKTIQKITPKPSLENLLSILQDKHAQLIDHLPYKCSETSDYSYLRIKPYLQEFLSCLEDYVLYYLPSNNYSETKHKLIQSLKFIDEATSTIHKLPNFTNSEYQYMRNLTYEQLINCWLILVNQETNCDTGNGLDYTEFHKIVEELDLLESLKQHGVQSGQEGFSKVIEAVQNKLGQNQILLSRQFGIDYGNDMTVSSSNGNRSGTGAGFGGGGGGASRSGSGSGTSSNALSDMITVDYSSYSLSNRSV